MRWRATTLALSMAATLLLAACGGSDRLSKAELVTKADAICKATRDKLTALPQLQAGADLVAYARKTTAIAQNTLDQLRALKPPSNLEKPYKTYQNVVVRAIAATNELADPAIQKNPTRLRQLQLANQSLSVQARAAAQTIGFKVCAVGQ